MQRLFCVDIHKKEKTRLMIIIYNPFNKPRSSTKDILQGAKYVSTVALPWRSVTFNKVADF